MRIKALSFLLLTVILAAGCTPSPKSSVGFTLPEGNAQQGGKTFEQLQCNACHTVEGVEFAEIDSPMERKIALGGETTYVRTYGNLVTSIINPSHRFATGYKEGEIKTEQNESKMRIYNDEMTVTQLTDLVAFLQQHYTFLPYKPTPYMPYYY